jgi:hypothetical protein
MQQDRKYKACSCRGWSSYRKKNIQECNKTGNTRLGVAEAGVVTGQNIQKCNKTWNTRLVV